MNKAIWAALTSAAGEVKGGFVTATNIFNTKHVADVKIIDEDTLYRIVQTENSQVAYTGKSLIQGAALTEEVFQVSRTILVGKQLITEYADDGEFTQRFDDPESLFGPIPYSNRYSILFDGANDYQDIAHDPLIDFDLQTEALSINLWLLCPNTTANVTYFEKQGGTAPGYRLYLNSNRLTADFRGTGTDRLRKRTNASTNFGTRVNDGNWHMITMTYNGSGDANDINFYLDAQLENDVLIQDNDLATSTNNTVNAAVAARTGGGNNLGPALVDEPSIHDIALTQTDVTAMYNNGAPIDLKGQGLSPITVNLRETWRQGDGPVDTEPGQPGVPVIIGVQSAISSDLVNMTSGNIITEVPS